MLPVLLLLSGLAALSTGAPTEDVPRCPHIACIAVYCEDPKPTYSRYEGTRCRACDKCPRQARQTKTEISCPRVACVDPGPCSVPYKQTFFIVDGKKCPACLVCPNGASKKDVPSCPNIVCAAVVCEDPKPTYMRVNGTRCRACDRCPRQVRAAKEPVICPMFACVDPGPCSVPYKRTFHNVDGKKCPACPVCPNGASKKDVPSCPNIVCAAVVCENPKPTYMRVNGTRCRSCDRCPRQVRAAKEPVICPMFACAYPGPCSVPYKKTFYIVDGKKCPGCPVCPPGKELQEQ